MRFPNDEQRLTIFGRTGSGKTQAASFHLSLRSWDKKPWVVYDYKIDGLLNAIKGVRHIGTGETPKHPGVYLVHPHPDDIGGVVAQMWRIWEQENTGVYVDEGYMVCSPNRPNPAFRTLLTQGRSLKIPMIVLSQRPVWLDRFVFSESDFYQVFSLNHFEDRKTAAQFVPYDINVKLPDYHSWYYDVGRDTVELLKPVPDRNWILERFESRMKNTQRRIFV